MYAIFKNDTSIILTDDGNILSEDNCFLWNDFNRLEEINNLISKSMTTVYLFHKNLEFMWCSFQKLYQVIEAGGGIVTNQKDNVLFIFRHDKWDLPKGKIEKGETKESASVREVEEECGLKNVDLLGYFKTTYHIYEERGVEILKVSYWHHMYSEELILIPQLEEGITDVAWVDQKDIPKLMQNTYPNIVFLMEMYAMKNQQ
ncbi:NUDIX hydrolase [Lutimonas sp.]|uniref:NUDIX hydrolase n=1 Tax=Lutimonas sp. TaxID=1872403 RepID=UPI003D9B4EC8